MLTRRSFGLTILTMIGGAPVLGKQLLAPERTTFVNLDRASTFYAPFVIDSVPLGTELDLSTDRGHTLVRLRGRLLGSIPVAISAGQSRAELHSWRRDMRGRLVVVLRVYRV